MELKFKDAYIQYLDYVECRLKNQSKRTLKERYKSKILPYWENYDIYKISELDYIKFQNFIEQNNYSNSYKRNLHYMMTSYFDFCVKFLNLSKNVASLVGPFKNKNEIKKSKTYNLSQFKKFIKYVDNDVYKQFFNLMFFTGTRPGEAMALRFSDLTGLTLSINKTIDEHGNREVNTPKTRSSIRKIKIDRKLSRDLLRLRKIYVSKYKDLNYDYYIFGGMKPLSPTTINRYKIKACEKANLFSIRLHDFRHSHATLLYQKHISVYAIKERLGHSNVNITMGTYIHPDNSQEKRVTRTLSFLRLFF